VLTVGPPCNCTSLSAYLNRFRTFGAASTRLEFNFHSAIKCTTGAGGCSGTLTVFAPRGAMFIDSRRVRNGATGVKLKRSTAVIAFKCSGQCSARTIQPAITLQWVAFKKVTVLVRRGQRFVRFTKTIPIRSFMPSGRAGKTIKVRVVESCHGATKTVVLKIKFDKHGQVDYRHSDLNGDGRADRGKLTNRNGFI
jgi:hypothetical protein